MPSPTAVPDYRAAARDAARRHGVPAEMFVKQIARESVNFDEDVIFCRRTSSAGAQGIAQFMPATASSLGVDPCDPLAALDAAAAYMSRLYRQFGKWALALAAYNAGEGNVMQYGGVPPFRETYDYLTYILGPGWPEPKEVTVPDGRLTTNDDANFRAAPGTSQPKLMPAPLKRGSPVWPTGQTRKGIDGHDWTQVAMSPVGWIASELLTAPAPPVALKDVPVRMQDWDWDCAQESLARALKKLGRNPGNSWMEERMLEAGVESTEVGLTDASGHLMADWINREYGDTVHAEAIPSLTWEDVPGLLERGALVAGGHDWSEGVGHWTGIDGYHDGVMELGNPGGHGPRFGQQTLNQAEWDARGPWSGVLLTRRS